MVVTTNRPSGLHHPIHKLEIGENRSLFNTCLSSPDFASTISIIIQKEEDGFDIREKSKDPGVRLPGCPPTLPLKAVSTLD
jgi:hypothetical protein